MKLIIVLILSVCFTLPVKRDSLIPTSFQLTADQLSKKEGKWHYFKKGNKIPVGDLIGKNFEIFDLPQGVSSRIEKEDTDDLGMSHYLLKLEMHGIPIEDGVYTAHYSKNGDLMHVVGKYDKNEIPKEKTFPRISRSEAFQTAKDAFISSEKITIQDQVKLVNDELSNFFNDGKIDPQLVYYRTDKNTSLKLCYKIDILSEELSRFLTFYIDAETGELLRITDHRTRAVATVETVYNGSQTVGVKWRGWPYSYYYLRMEAFSTPIETRNSSFSNGYPYCIPWGFGNLDRVYKGNLNWPVDFKYNAASSHWAVKEAYNVFYNTFGRTYGTFSSSGGEIRMENYYTRSDLNGFGPFYEPGGSYDYIHVGNTIGTSGFEGSLDVIAHEFTHGVMYRARGISGDVYRYPSNEEAGALCESFADIFGIIVERHTTGTTDYVVGSDLLSNFRRSIQNPRSYPIYTCNWYNDFNCVYQISDLIPDTYAPLYWHESPYWVSGYDGSYNNNSVQNFWFYLLWNGGYERGVNVTGIGLDNASQIVYRNMVYYFSMASDFDDMRQASIVNAIVLFGECSDQYKQVMNAWAAVNVGTPAPDPCIVPLTVDISGPYDSNCGNNEYYSSYVTGGNGNYTYQWSVNSYPVSSSSTLYYYFPEEIEDTYYISLWVTDGEQNAYANMETYVYCGYMKSSVDDALLLAYPNPVSNILNLKINKDTRSFDKEYVVNIYDKYGKTMYTTNTKDVEIQINVSSYISGNYFVTVSNDGKKASTVFVKK
jgi:Zn-dependent metalloprotease